MERLMTAKQVSELIEVKPSTVPIPINRSEVEIGAVKTTMMEKK